MGCRPRARSVIHCHGVLAICLPTFQPPMCSPSCTAGSPLVRFRQPPNSDVAAPKHHGSEWRIGPAAGISECQTLLSELPNFKPSIRLPTFQPPICLPCCTAGSPLLAFVDLQTAMSQHQNTMAVKDGSGPRPAAHSAKRCFLTCLETSFKPSMCLPTFQPPIRSPSCTAGSPLARFRRPPNGDVAGPKHHGSEGRIGPAAGSPECQTLLSELPRN